MDTAKNPTLILEGPGDKAAVPLLMRMVYHDSGVFDAHPTPRPKLGADVKKLLIIGQLERYVEFALREDGDSVLIVLDCDDGDVAEVIREFEGRIHKMNAYKRVECALFQKEYEAIFLYCLDDIANKYPDYGWNIPIPLGVEPEMVRGVKEFLSGIMSKERSYKSTRDQARFTSSLSINKLRLHSASFNRFRDLILGMARGE